MDALIMRSLMQKQAKKSEAVEYVRKAGPGIGAVTGAAIGAAKGGKSGALKGALTGAGIGWMPDVLMTAAEETAKKVKTAGELAIGSARVLLTLRERCGR